MSQSKEVPGGFKFCPSDEALVRSYLLGKICGREISDFEKDYVRECDLYGKEEPSSIWKSFNGKDNEDLFIITKLKRFTKKNGEMGSRVVRKVGVNGGTWHGETAPEDFTVYVEGLNDSVVATRKRFNYRNPGSEEHYLWIMQELSLKNNDDYVICRLRKNSRGAKLVDNVDRRKKRATDTAISRNFSVKMQKIGHDQNVPEGHDSELAIIYHDELSTEPEKQQQFKSDDDSLSFNDYMMSFTFDVGELCGDSAIFASEMNDIDTDDGILSSDMPISSSCAPSESPQCCVFGTENEYWNDVATDGIGEAEDSDEITIPDAWSAYFESVIPEFLLSQERDIKMLPNELYMQAVIEFSNSHPI